MANPVLSPHGKLLKISLARKPLIMEIAVVLLSNKSIFSTAVSLAIIYMHMDLFSQPVTHPGIPHRCSTRITLLLLLLLTEDFLQN